jgi:hypothetical protein
VRGEPDERRRLGQVPDDADPLEAEAVGDGRAGSLQDGTGAKLASGERARQRVERLELDMRLAGYGMREVE